jgi:hypothetical protein
MAGAERYIPRSELDAPGTARSRHEHGHAYRRVVALLGREPTLTPEGIQQGLRVTGLRARQNRTGVERRLRLGKLDAPRHSFPRPLGQAAPGPSRSRWGFVGR